MDRIDETRYFSKESAELVSNLTAMYSAIAERLNFILDRIIEVDGETGLEIMAPDNNPGDDGNFFLTVNSTGDFVFKIKESGSWVRRGLKVKGS